MSKRIVGIAAVAACHLVATTVGAQGSALSRAGHPGPVLKVTWRSGTTAAEYAVPTVTVEPAASGAWVLITEIDPSATPDAMRDIVGNSVAVVELDLAPNAGDSRAIAQVTASQAYVQGFKVSGGTGHALRLQIRLILTAAQFRNSSGGAAVPTRLQVAGPVSDAADCVVQLVLKNGFGPITSQHADAVTHTPGPRIQSFSIQAEWAGGMGSSTPMSGRPVFGDMTFTVAPGSDVAVIDSSRVRADPLTEASFTVVSPSLSNAPLMKFELNTPAWRTIPPSSGSSSTAHAASVLASPPTFTSFRVLTMHAYRVQGATVTPVGSVSYHTDTNIIGP